MGKRRKQRRWRQRLADREMRVDRAPGKIMARVAAGTARSRDLARPRWRALAERIEQSGLHGREREALRVLVEVVERRADLLLGEGRFGSQTHAFIDGLIALARARKHWIRDPRDWRARTHNAERQFASVVRHLVARYSVPSFLDAAWLRGDAEAARYRDWYLRIGAGENIFRRPGPIAFTRRVVHHFLRAPERYSIEHALRFGQAVALGGDERLAAAVVATRLGRSFENEGFWESVIRFLARHPEIDRAQVGPVVDFLQHQRFEPQDFFVARGVRRQLPPPQPSLSMKGRSAASLLRQVERWHRELRNLGRGVGLQWAASGIGGLELETGTPEHNLRVWRIRELRSGGELAAEGRAMRHCVAAYASLCAGGHCSIWTLEVDSFEETKKRLTIEVSRERVIEEARGRCNALPRRRDREILRLWAEREGLDLAHWIARCN